MPKSKLRPPAKASQIRPPDRFDLLDEAMGSCLAIEVLGQLLGMAGMADDVEGVLAAETGWMIKGHAQKLHETLKTLRKSPGS